MACVKAWRQEEANGGDGHTGGAGLEASTFENLDKCTHAHTQFTVHTDSACGEREEWREMSLKDLVEARTKRAFTPY